MRTQRRAPVTVTLVHVVTTDNGLGDTTTETTFTTVEGAIFEPQQILEQTGNDQVPVVQPAVFNVPGVHELDADDLVLLGTVTAETLAAYAGARWFVVGGGAVWLDRTKVPVSETRSV